MKKEEFRGSEWRKWDLHFHTPSSYDYKNKAISNEQLIEGLLSNGISVVAITDHHVIDVNRIFNLQTLSSSRVTILPGIEFLADARGEEPIHFIGIFSEKSEIEWIWKQIQSRTNIKKVEGERKNPREIYCDLEETVKLIKELGGIVSIHAGTKSNSIENITHALPHGVAQKEDIARLVDIFELGKLEDVDGYTTKVNRHLIKQIGKELPLIICSDNHNILAYETETSLWIKAEPNFEGLKQIIFEPKIRVHLGNYPPINPPIRINKVVFNFQNDAQLDGEAFCLRGDREILFSPNLTCLIGGRGTGKSTVLNLIHERLKKGENRFFQTKKISHQSGKLILIQDTVHVDDDNDEKYIEYFGQNEIEEFAKDLSKLTNAVYSRILKRDESNLLVGLESKLQAKFDLFRSYIVRKRKNILLQEEIAQKEKELETNKKIIESFSSETYTGITNEIKELNAEYNLINHSKAKFNELLEDLGKLISRYKSDNSKKSSYTTAVDSILVSLEKIVGDSNSLDFSDIVSRSEAIIKQLDQKNTELNAYLQDKGLTEENRKDISNSSKVYAHLEVEIKKFEETIEFNKKLIDAFNFAEVGKISDEYRAELERQIKSVGDVLSKIEDKSIRSITLKFAIDQTALENSIFEDFKKMFEGQINKGSHKGDQILKEVLFSFPVSGDFTSSNVLSAIKSNTTMSAAKPFLIDLLERSENYESYELIVKRAHLNVSEFRRINVEYDGRLIKDTSFGQRCTAVLVILLLLGNNPIIIDEPEAHLDSLLICSYLVYLIKEKKQHRQIIFATHNANFVVNGDAELIHILDFDVDNKITKVKSTTIENVDTRAQLIGLEGGLEAFKRRENKYQVGKFSGF